MVAPEKVWVEAESAPGGAVLSLRDVRQRRALQEEFGRHNVTLPTNELQHMGFPPRFLDDLEQGRPVQFKMKHSAYVGLLGGTGRLNGLGELGADASGGGPSFMPNIFGGGVRAGEEPTSGVAKRKYPTKGAIRQTGSGGYTRMGPETYCVYKLEKEVGGLHRGRVMRYKGGEMCETSESEADDQGAYERLLAQVGNRRLTATKKRSVLAPIQELKNGIWVGRHTGANLEGLEGLDGYNQPDYHYYVVLEDEAYGVHMIESGWSFKEDAEDQIENVRALYEPKGATLKVFSSMGIRRKNLDPNYDDNWWKG